MKTADATAPKRDYVNENDWAPAEIERVLDLAAEVKKRPDDWRTALAGKSLAMIFEKSSTRTRVSFEAGMFQLGGLGMFLSSRDLQLGRGEPISDTARVLSRYVDGIMARTYAHATVEDLARFASIPVINGLSDLLHPCQALADFHTVRERFGSTRGSGSATSGTATTSPTASSSRAPSSAHASPSSRLPDSSRVPRWSPGRRPRRATPGVPSS